MTDVSEARTALAVMEKGASAEVDKQAEAFQAGVEAFCKESGIDPNIILENLDESAVEEAYKQLKTE